MIRPRKVTCACGQPVKDAYVCSDCARQLAKDLGDIPALAEDLAVTRTRQSRLGGRGAGVVVRSEERPLPWDERAARVTVSLQRALLSWVQLVSPLCHVPRLAGPACSSCSHPTCRAVRPPAVRTDADILSMSRWLLGQVEWLRHHPLGSQAVKDLGRAVSAARTAIDRPEDRVFLGICSAIRDGGDLCPVDVYAIVGETTAKCPSCGASHVVEDRRRKLLHVVDGQLLSATDLSRILTLYGQPVTQDRIWKWKERGRIAPHGVNAAGDPIYLVSEVRDLVAAIATRQQKAAG
jgi:hypothetical protein